MLPLPLDPYAVLGLKREATQEEIHSAYRVFVKHCHPDKNPDPLAASVFRNGDEAYQVLKDPERRLAYDRFVMASQVADRSSNDIRQTVSVGLQLAFEGGVFAIAYSRRVLGSWVATTKTIQIPRRASFRSVVLVEGGGHIDQDRTGDLLVQITYSATDGQVEMSCVGNIHCELTVPWSAALRRQTIRFSPFSGGKETFDLKLDRQPNGHHYRIPGEGMHPGANIFVKVFYQLPVKMDDDQAAMLANIMEGCDG